MFQKKYTQLLFTCCLVAFSFITVAQSNQLIGIVKDKKSKEPIAFAAITNNSTLATVMSNSKGIFKLSIQNNQLVSVAAVGYHFDTLFFQAKKQDTLFIYLNPLTQNLQGVTVTGSKKYSAYQLDSIERRRLYFGSKSSKKQSTFSTGNDGVGMGINLDKLYSKQEKQRSKYIDLYYSMEDQEYINYRFNAALVTKYTGLQNEALESFMEKYRPTTAWLRQHTNEEDLLYYINDKLKDFKKQ